MKQIQAKVLNALLTNCKNSDRKIAMSVGTSQPTVTRQRQQLEKTQVIKAYLAIPNYAKLSFQFGAITLCELDPDTPLNEHSVILSAPAVLCRNERILVTLHRNMEDFGAFLTKVTLVENPVLFVTADLEVKPVQVPLKGEKTT